MGIIKPEKEVNRNQNINRANSPLQGLGLMLMEENGKIRIRGKADPMVPAAFRDVMFRPPSFIESLNGKVYTSLQDFKEEFGKIKTGETFKIQFMIQGELKFFEGKKIK